MFELENFNAFATCSRGQNTVLYSVHLIKYVSDFEFRNKYSTSCILYSTVEYPDCGGFGMQLYCTI